MSKLKKIISKMFYNLPIKFLLKNIILLESNPDFSDNTRGVYDKLIEFGYNMKYQLIWITSNSEVLKDIKEKMFFLLTEKILKK